MKRPTYEAVLVLSLLLGGAVPFDLKAAVVGGEAVPGSQAIPERIDLALRAMISQSPDERVTAFYLLVDIPEPAQESRKGPRPVALRIRQILTATPSRGEAVRQAVLQLAAVESKRMRENRFSEEWSNYAADVLTAVGALRDGRAAPILAANLDLGNITTKAAAALGAPMIPFVLPKLSHESAPMRNGAVRALSQLLSSSPVPALSQVERNRVRDALVPLANDDSRFIRLSVIEALSMIAGDDVTRVLQRIAESDPYAVDAVTGQRRYPVREQAKRYLVNRKPVGGFQPRRER